MSEQQPPAPPTLVSLASVVLITGFSIYLLIIGESILIPLVLATFITYLLVALGHALERIRIGKVGLPRGLALTAAIILFLLGIAVLVQLIAGNLRLLVEAAPAYQQRFEELLGTASAFAARTFNGGQPITVAALLQQIDLQTITARLVAVFQAFARNTFQIIIYVAFLLLEINTFDRKVDAMFPGESRRAVARSMLRQIGHKIERYVLIKTFDSFLVGCCNLIVLTAIGVDFAPFWALLHFILNFVPYIGPAVAITLPSLFALLQFESVPVALLAAGILATTQALVDNFIEPKLAGRTLNLSPITIMLGLSVWGTMWGIIGMILSVPIMVLVMIVLSQFPQTRPLAVLMSQRGDIH